jgi:hypothetical protein
MSTALRRVLISARLRAAKNATSARGTYQMGGYEDMRAAGTLPPLLPAVPTGPANDFRAVRALYFFFFWFDTEKARRKGAPRAPPAQSRPLPPFVEPTDPLRIAALKRIRGLGLAQLKRIPPSLPPPFDRAQPPPADPTPRRD